MENYLKRAVFQDFGNKVLPNKVLILLGARRVGKTELIKNYLQTIPDGSYLQLNGEDINDANLLKERSVANYKRLLLNIDLLVIDEAQTIPDIGLILKLIVDAIDGIKIIATGSSIFDLNNNLGEPLVGRKKHVVSFSIGTNGIFPIRKLQTNYRKIRGKITLWKLSGTDSIFRLGG